MQIHGNQRRLAGTDQPPVPPLPPGPVPGPGGPVVTVPNATGPQQHPIGVVFAGREALSHTFTVSFSFDLTVAVNASDSGKRVDSIELLLLSGPKSNADAVGAILENEIVYKSASARPLGAWRLTGAGEIVVAQNYFDGNVHRTWTLALRARAVKSASGVFGPSEIVQSLVLSLPVMGNSPPFLEFSDHP